MYIGWQDKWENHSQCSAGIEVWSVWCLSFAGAAEDLINTFTQQLGPPGPKVGRGPPPSVGRFRRYDGDAISNRGKIGCYKHLVEHQLLDFWRFSAVEVLSSNRWEGQHRPPRGPKREGELKE